MTPQEQYIRDQRAWIKQTKIKQGDKVKVIATPSPESWPQDCSSSEAWQRYVGEVYVYDHSDNVGVVHLLPTRQKDLNKYGMPFFILAKIDE